MGDLVREVAIVGGGCAGITAAFELTRPENKGKYHVTLYQMGWRLGGKGASGRGVNDRIEEHGLHLWMGFYENAFKLLRECYSELDRDPATHPMAEWTDAFTKNPFVGVADRCNDAQWRPWTADFPVDAANPGDPLTEHNPFSTAHYLTRATSLLTVLFTSLQAKHSGNGPAESPGHTGKDSDSSAAGILNTIADLTRLGQLGTVAGLFEAVQLLEVMLEKIPQIPIQAVQTLLNLIRANTSRLIGDLIAKDDEARRLWEIADVILACIQGAIRFNLLTDPRGFDAIDEYDWRDWLKLNGASDSSVDSAFMRGIYDLLFAYEQGDFNRPRMSAGQALRGAVRMFFSSRGAIFWKMKAGMGDVVFAPFYEVLKKRGVTFKFFHRLDAIKIADSATQQPGELPYIEALEFSEQARIKNNAAYSPLTEVKGLATWSANPDFDQLVDGDVVKAEQWDFESDWDKRQAGTKTLKVSEDFDLVVLAVGLGAVPAICKDIIASNSRWSDMVKHVATVETQALQIWMRESMTSLGWNLGPINLSGFVTPFDTWADMSHLISIESWPTAPSSIAYFCSALPESAGPVSRLDQAYPSYRANEVRDNCINFLNHHIKHLWPAAEKSEGGFRWDLLVDAVTLSTTADDAVLTEANIDSQFWSANVNASDRYVQSLPGTAQYRISPLELHYDNLTVAGDWTECSHNAGCVEAAVMSGRLAAHALSGYPALCDIVAYDHP